MGKSPAEVEDEDGQARELAKEILLTIRTGSKTGEFTESLLRRVFGRSKRVLISRAVKILEDDGEIRVKSLTYIVKNFSTLD